MGTEDFEPPRDEAPEPSAMTRQESFDSAEPIEMELSVTAGRITVRLGDEPGVHVEVRHDPTAGSPWMSSISGLFNWMSGQFGGEDEPVDVAAEAVSATRVDFTGRRLVVSAPKPLPLRPVPLAITVRAPNGSQVTTRAGSAEVTITGSAGTLDLTTGTGTLSAERSEGRASVKTGSGTVRLGPMLGGLRARSGTGEVEVSSVGGSSVLMTGSGDIWLGAVQGDVSARSGSGDVTVADAASGKIQLGTGSGALRIAIRSGVAAQIDLSSGSGQVHSDLDVRDEAPEGPVELTITGRTGSGEVAVSTAS